MKALVVEDDVLLAGRIKQALEDAGWTVEIVHDGDDGLRRLSTRSYDLSILDWDLPRISGLEILERLSAISRHVPTILMTVRGDVDDRIHGLRQGADDCIVKPFAMAELVARAHALYRRTTSQRAAVLTLGSLTLNLPGHEVTRGDEKIDFTGKEFDLFTALATSGGRLVDRDRLLRLMYHVDDAPESNSLDVLLARVRKKISGTGVDIATIRGKGFVLRVTSPDASTSVSGE